MFRSVVPAETEGMRKQHQHKVRDVKSQSLKPKVSGSRVILGPLNFPDKENAFMRMRINTGDRLSWQREQ
jgi:hypothetical protein